jgi:lipase chaperone LimK
VCNSLNARSSGFVLRLESAKQLHEALVEKLKIATESTLSAEERAAQMDELMADEEKRQIEIDQDLKKLRTQLFKKTQELHEAKTNERNIEAEIQVRLFTSEIFELQSCFAGKSSCY